MFIVNLLGAGLVLLIVWWFWLYRPPAARIVGGKIRITVADGVYEPSLIELEAEQPSDLVFLRKDPSPCAEAVIFPDLQIVASLLTNQETLVALPPLKKGDYAFHCQMQMYRGTVRVK